ncbi:MAG: phosphate acyltransferase PlsX [Eubacterium sp.]|nr:phosphate acyltransferase PlsX [Eubacterium sp.]
MKIIIDCLGGDNSPDANVEGAILALRKHQDLSVVLTGDENKIKEILNKRNQGMDRIEIVHAPDVITGEDKPTEAVRFKKDSSMIRAIKILREDDSADALVSNGATGALVASTVLRIGRVEGVRRPVFCPLVPNMKGGVVGICDSGANPTVTSEMLLQFAVMGSKYLENVYKIKNPRVGLLNIGTESEKGDDLRREAYKLLSEAKGINFAGNMEARELLSGDFDLVVCDGFSGNVLVKSVEGTALMLLKKLKDDIYSKKKYKFGAFFMRKMFAEEKEFMNYQNYGGSVMLGIEKTIVKGHGSSDRKAVLKCIDQAYRMVKSGLNEKTAKAIKENMPE